VGLQATTSPEYHKPCYCYHKGESPHLAPLQVETKLKNATAVVHQHLVGRWAGATIATLHDLLGVCIHGCDIPTNRDQFSVKTAGVGVGRVHALPVGSEWQRTETAERGVGWGTLVSDTAM